MMQASDHMEGYQWVVAGVADLKDNYQGIDARVKVVFSDTYNLLKHAEVALVASGTATLETALIGTPQVVCYEISAFTYMIARHMVKVKFISLVNLIMDKEVIRELIQSEFNVENTRSELQKLMVPANREKMLSEYAALRDVLGGKGASERAAHVILDHLK
jgi:lipid-A-disaccharide synthase